MLIYERTDTVQCGPYEFKRLDSLDMLAGEELVVRLTEYFDSAKLSPKQKAFDLKRVDLEMVLEQLEKYSVVKKSFAKGTPIELTMLWLTLQLHSRLTGDEKKA